MDTNEYVLNKLYLDPINEAKSNRRSHHQIYMKPLTKTRSLSTSHSVSDLMENLNGNIILQSWSTKPEAPKEMLNFLNLPIIIDRTKIKRLIEQSKKLPALNKFKLKSPRQNEDSNTETKLNPNEIDKNIIEGNNLITTGNKSKFSFSNYSKRSFMDNINNRYNRTHRSNNITDLVEFNKKENTQALETIKETTDVNELQQFSRNENKYGLVKSNSMSNLNQVQIIYTAKGKKRLAINFETFDKHLYLHDNDFLYAKRVGGPVDFALCSYQEINKKSISNSLSSGLFRKLQKTKPISYSQPVTPIQPRPPDKNTEYITISKNTVLHYQKGVPHIYTMVEWVDNYVKYKKLMNVPLFKNFKIAKLFELWRRYFKRTKRAYLTEKLKKKFHLIDIHLLKGMLEIKKLLRYMKHLNLFKLDIPSPVNINQFNQIYVENLRENNRKVDEFRSKIKRELSQACNSSYREFKKSKNITLDDNINENAQQKAQDDNDNNTNNNARKRKVNAQKQNSNSVQAFLKDAIPYAQDATRKTHYKKILKYIRLMDFLFNESKFKMILFSLDKLNQKFQRLYDVYVNSWTDHPILITTIKLKPNTLIFEPSIESIRTVIFDHFIQENIYAVIYKKNFIDPQEFPTYMSCFEEVFEISVDQNSNLNGRLRDNEIFISTFKLIQTNFDKCYKALNKYVTNLNPVLTNYLEYTSINFDNLEKTATPEQLKDLITKLYLEEETVHKLPKKINIGVFEFQLDNLLDKVLSSPQELMSKLFTVIPILLVRKLKSLIADLLKYDKTIEINPNDVEAFLQLKKASEQCTVVKPSLEEQNDEIRELLNIVNNYKDIKMQDYDLKLISDLAGARSNFERRYDSVSYYIDNNIKRFRAMLQKTIKDFDKKIITLINEINGDELNTYNDDSSNAIMILEDKSRQIQKAVENKKVYQQQEIDIEMDENQLSNFENLDTLTYEYDLKINLWTTVNDFQEKSKEWDQKQVTCINLPDMNLYVSKWVTLCNVAIVDLDNVDVPTKLLEHVVKYEKIIPIVTAIQNNNIQEIDYLRDNLKALLGITFPFDDINFTLEKLMNLNSVEKAYNDLTNLNTQANEERRLKDIYKSIGDKISSHKIPLQMKNDADKGSKYVIYTNDFENEYEFIEENLMILNKELLNQYVDIIRDNYIQLINGFNKYIMFLEMFNTYQIFMLKIEGLTTSTEFSKEMPTEYKKLSSESLNKTLIKNLKDYINLDRYIMQGHDRIITNLTNIINNYETHYHNINIYLERKRKENQPLFLLSNDDLMELFIGHESLETRSRLLLKLYPWIINVKPGNENDETLQLETYEHEICIFKYTKNTRTLRDAIETIEQGLMKREKESFKMFKREYDNSSKPKSMKTPREVVFDFVRNKDKDKDTKESGNLGQVVFCCVYYYVIDSIEKGLSNEEEAFDKLFDLYNESKNIRRVRFIKMLKNEGNNNTVLQNKILLSLIALENHFITVIENLIREDVTSTADFTFMKVINYKIENENLMLKLYNYNYEYGYEYVGLQNNFYILNQSERMFVNMFNILHLHKPFVIYSNNDYFHLETFHLVSKCFGKYVYTLSPSHTGFTLRDLNHNIFAYMRSGAWIYIKECNTLSKEIFGSICDRIIEVYRCIKASDEEGVYTDVNGDTYEINIKGLTTALYCRDVFGSGNSNLPKVVRDYYRVYGIIGISVEMYLRINLNNFVFCNIESIVKKIMFVLDSLKSKVTLYHYSNNDIRNYNHHMHFYYIKLIKRHLRSFISCIRPDNEMYYIMNAMQSVLVNFIEDKSYLQRLLINVFDTKRTQNTKSISDDDMIDNEFESALHKELSLFRFENDVYENKVKGIYRCLGKYQHIVIVGDCLSGKSNVLVTLNEISRTLNKINSTKYKKVHYVKIFQKAYETNDIFCSNDVKKAHQNNNVLFNNMLMMFDDYNERMLDELEMMYHQAISCPGAMKLDRSKYVLHKEHANINKEDINKDNNDITLSNNEQQNEQMQDKPTTQESPRDNNNTTPPHQDTSSSSNQYNCICFDGNIDIKWLSHLTFITNSHNIHTFPNGDHIDTSPYTFIYETTSLSQLSPDLITKQMLFTLPSTCLGWDNIAYAFVETNAKLNKNADLKNYIRGLFENYIPPILDFIHVNKLKCINNYSLITDKYIILNFMRFFDAVLPNYDFNDNKIGRRNKDAIPKIEKIKTQTLCFFIFSCAWVINFLTDFLIKTKIEKLINDVFKTDDLKGPIFDYYIPTNNPDNYEFDLWINKFATYQQPTFNKNEIFYYNKLFITTIENLPYQTIIEQFITNNVPFLLIGRDSCGKSFLMKHMLSQMQNTIRSVNVNLTYNTTSHSFEKYISSHLDQVKKNILSDKFNRNVVFYIDDIHIAYKDEDNNIPIHEMIRQMLSTFAIYDHNENYFKYMNNINIVNVGNYVSHIPHNEQFNRFVMKMNIITINIHDETYAAFYKPSLEFCYRNYIPNTSGITANQYIGTLFKLKELLNAHIPKSFDNLHYCFNMRDITNIVQCFHLFIFEGTNEYPEYIKKIFFYESYLLYRSKINNENDFNVFKEKICEAYSSFFKQDKVKSNDIFNENVFNNVNTYIYAKNYLDEDKTKINSHVYYAKKQPLIDFIYTKINEYFNGKYNSLQGDVSYVIDKFKDDYVIETLIRMLRILEYMNKNILLLGDDFSGKDVLLKIALFINKYDLYEIDMHSFNTSKTYKDFECDNIYNVLKSAIFNNKVVFLLISYQITSYSNTSQHNYILELISTLMNSEYAYERFKEFINDKANPKLSYSDILSRIESNINIVLSFNIKTPFYTKLFLNYPFIVNNSSVIYVESLSKQNYLHYAKQTLQLTTLPQPPTTEEQQVLPGNNEHLLTLIHSYASKLYETYSTKLNMHLPITQVHFIRMCNFIINNYISFKNSLLDKKNNLHHVQGTLTASDEVIKSMQSEINKLTPQKEAIEAQIEQNKHKIGECTQEKSVIKGKRLEEERPMNHFINECNNKEKALTELLDPYIEGVRQHALLLQKLTEKDIVEIKNTYDNSLPGKYMLGKVYECLKETNTEWDNIKKTIEVKTFKHFVAVDISKAPEYIINITQEIISNPDYGNGGDKYQKPYRIVGILCDYFVSCWNYFGEYVKQKEVLEQIKEMKTKIAEHKAVIKTLNEDFKKVELRSNEYEKTVSSLEMTRSNFINQIQKHISLLKEINDFANNTKEKESIWKEKEALLINVISNYDLYIIYISAYVIYAPVLNASFRQRFTSFIYNELSQCKNATSEFKTFSFNELMLLILDNNDNKDRDLLMAVETLDDFVKENFIIMKKIFPTKTPYIIDYNQIAKKTIEKVVEFKEMKSINHVSETAITRNELCEKIEKSFISGNVLFISEVTINIYNYLINYIHNKTFTESYKRYVYIDKKKIEINDNAQLYLLKTEYNSTIDIDAFNNALIINFNSHCSELKGKIFHLIGEANNKNEYYSYRKSRNEYIKENYKLIELENKMNKSIMSFDMSGNVEKLTNMQVLNERYKQEVQLFISMSSNIESIKERVNTLRESLYSKYGIISEHVVKLYKWIYRYFVFDISYVISLEYFCNVVDGYLQLKTKELNKGKEDDNEEEYSQHKDDSLGDIEDDNYDNVKSSKVKYVYNAEKDLKELIVYVYNQIAHVYVSNHRKEILLLFLFEYLHIKNVIGSKYKQWLCYMLKLQHEMNNNKLEKSPVKNISDIDWTKLQKMNTHTSHIFDDILNDMISSSTKWSEYLSEDQTVIETISIHYLKDTFRFPSDDIEHKTNEFIRFVFFYLLKPFRFELILDTIINNILAFGENVVNCNDIHNDDTVLVQAFRYLPMDKFMLLSIPNDNGKVQLNYYDKELRDYCIKELIECNPDVKYKEIIAKGELTLNEVEAIQVLIKNGSVVIIKNIHLIKESFTNIITQFKETISSLSSIIPQQQQQQQLQIANDNPDEQTIQPSIPQVCKLILITQDNTLLPSYLFATSTFIGRIHKQKLTIRDSILNLLRTFPQKLYTTLLNSQTATRKILRKFILHYILLYGIISTYEHFHLFIPFSIKDFYSITSYIETFFTMYLPEEKLPQFLNSENQIGFTYPTLLNLINEQFIIGRFIYKNDISIIKRILSFMFNSSSFSDTNNTYISICAIHIDESSLPLEENITNESLYNVLMKYTNNDYETIITNVLKKNNTTRNNKLQCEMFDSFISDISKTILGKNEYCNNNNTGNTNDINVDKVYTLITKIKNGLPKKLYYNIDEVAMLPDENIEINQFLFKINKVNDYTNPLDECLLNEILYYNSYLHKITTLIDNIIQMLQGKRTLHYDEHSFNNIYYEALTALNKGYIPLIFIDDKIFKQINKTKYTITVWQSILTSRFDILRLWIKDGQLNSYHLPLFTNINLFFSRVKVHFIRKILNDIANNNNVQYNTFISPDMVKLNIHFTRFDKYEDIDDNNKEGLQMQYGFNNGEGDVVYITGLNLFKGKFEKDNTSISCVGDDYDNECICSKCNVGIIWCSVRKYNVDEENNVDLECDVEKNEFDEDYDDDEEYDDDNEGDEDEKGKKDVKERENGEEKESEVLYVKVVDGKLKNDDNVNCYDECLEVFEVEYETKDEVVMMIEKGVKLFIDDIDEFSQSKLNNKKGKDNNNSKENENKE